MEEHKIGEIKRGRLLGFKSAKNKWMWDYCRACGKERWVMMNKGKPMYPLCQQCVKKTPEFRAAISKRMTGFNLGEKSANWKGGTYLDSNGYIMVPIYPPSPYFKMGQKSKGYFRYRVLEHRLVMAQHLGRCLKRGEIVHHKNGVKDDNRIENLELMKPWQHIKDHNKGYADGFNKGYADGLKMALSSKQTETTIS